MLDWLFGKKKQTTEQEKQKKSKKQMQEQNKWKYDLIVQFLSGPLWKTSVLDFVDYHCVVFDSEEENKFQYTTIHNKFKELVANLFDGMMEEVGLNEEQLVLLLQRGFESKQKKIFHQLLLADDFMKFKNLMVKRNKTLEAEAIKAINQTQGRNQQYIPTSKSQQQVLRESKIIQQSRQKKLEMEEEEQLRKVLQMSKLEADEQEQMKKLEKKAEMHDSKKQELEAQTQQTKQEEKKQQEQIVIPMPKGNRRKKPANLQPLPPIRTTQHKQEHFEKIEKVEEPVQQTKVEEPEIPEKKFQEPEKIEHIEPPVEAQEDRKKRLMQQREKIRRKKEEERKKAMNEQESSNKPPVQSIVLQEDGIHETNIGVPQNKVSQEEIERRKALMKKIKNKIIDDF